MNVNQVAMPVPALTAPLAVRAEPQQAPTPGSNRGDARPRPQAPEAPAGQIRPDAGGDSRADSADRQKAEQLKAFIGDSNMRLSIYHDEASDRSIVEVRNQTTGDVVSQYPSEELIRLYAALRQSLVDESA